MNKQRRSEIEKIIEKAEALQFEIEEVKETEQDYYYNAPENLQSGEKYQQSETALDNLESAVSNIEDLISALHDSIEG